jgi:surface protein
MRDASIRRLPLTARPRASAAAAPQSTFYSASAFNQSLATWDTSRVTTLQVRHRPARSSLCVPRLDLMRDASIRCLPLTARSRASAAAAPQETFRSASAFNQPLATWDTSRVTTLFVRRSSARSSLGVPRASA